MQLFQKYKNTPVCLMLITTLSRQKIRYFKSYISNAWCKTLVTTSNKCMTSYHKSVSFSKAQLPNPKIPTRDRKKIKIFPPPSSPTQKYKEPMKNFTQDQIALLDSNGSRTHLFSRSNPEAAKVGDILLVKLKDGEPFAGVCINIRRRGIDTAILLRSQLTRVGVEMWYKIYSPNLAGIEVVQRKVKRARRARLTYMRKPEHDLGSVQNIVLAYYRSKGALRDGVIRENESKTDPKNPRKRL